MSIKQSLSSTSSELQRLVESAVDIAISSKKKSQIIEAYNLIYDQVDKVTASIPLKATTFSATKKSLRVVNNLVGGTLDGLHSSDLSLKQVRALATDLLVERLPVFLEVLDSDIHTHNKKYGITQANLKVAEESLSNTKTDPVTASLVAALNPKKKTPSKKSLCSAKTFQQALTEAVKNLTLGTNVNYGQDEGEEELNVEPDKKGDETRTFLRSLESKRSLLPATLGKQPFTILRMPIVPIFNAVDRSGGIRVQGLSMNVKAQPNPSYILNHVGIKAVAVEEYVVIDNQLLLAINLDALPTETVIQRRKEVQIPMKPEKYVKFVLQTLAESTPNTYELVDENSIKNPRTPRIQLYWIMPAKTLSVLSRKGFPKIRQWGLPFRTK